MSRLAFVTRRPVAITMLVIALGVFGAVSLSKLSLDLLPRISYPTLTVRTTWEGAAPEDVEERVTERVQESLSTLPGLVRSSSISRAETSDVLLEFAWNTGMTFAVQDVREELDGIFLPEGAARPLILRYDPNLDPILRIGLTAARAADERRPDDTQLARDLIQLRWLAENRIQRELEAIPGVAAVEVRGGLQEEIRVRVDPHLLAVHGIDPSEVASRLAAENINASGGSLLEGSAEYLVRTVNQFQHVSEIEQLPLSRRGGALIRIRDVGVVERTYEKREVKSRIGGEESVELAIYREAGANVVDLADRVNARLFGTQAMQAKAEEQRATDETRGRGTTMGEREALDFLAWRFRDDAKFTLLSDQSTFIRGAVNDVRDAAILGALFAVAVLWLFLRRLAPTTIVALAIPISILVTFAPMFLAGVSLNIMSLGGLALGVGMLVDNAIVVLESITRCREEGDDVDASAVRGTSEVAGAVVASTLTTVSVFAPIVFVTGIAGQIFGDQALTVVSSLLVSLFVAIFFIPMLASRRFDLHATAGTESGSAPGFLHGLDWRPLGIVPSLALLLGRTSLFLFRLVATVVSMLALLVARLVGYVLWPIGYAFGKLWDAVERAYPPFLGVMLRVWWLVLPAAAVLGWLAWQRVGHLGVELLPPIHQGEFTAHVELPVGTPLTETDAVLDRIDRDVQRLPGVATTALTVGVETETLTRDIEGSHTARLTVRLTEGARGAEAEERLIDAVRERISRAPEVEGVEVRRPTPFALAAPIAVEILGYDLEAMGLVAAEVMDRLRGLDGIADLKSTVRPGFPEARVTFDRDKTLEFGLDLAAVSMLVRDQVLGNVSTRFQEGDERIGIRVIGDEAILNTLDAVLALPVNPSALNPVPLRSVANVSIVQGPAEIRRIGNSRAIVIEAESSGLDLGGLGARIEAELAQVVAPDDVKVQLGGQKREMDAAMISLRNALFLAVFLVYVVMASQFESFVQPLVILVTVPLAGIGVVFALDLLAMPLSVVVFIGLILLAGIVVNNAIVLVDRINQRRRAGIELVAATLEAAHTRVRPILMTTATTALGLLPMTGWLPAVEHLPLLGGGDGAELRAPMAVTVVTGLVTSTLLTLVVIPVVYVVLARLGQAFGARRELVEA
ncbi:MAG: efflux RND transporter permease subunit [Planctomycetota bacterium]